MGTGLTAAGPVLSSAVQGCLSNHATSLDSCQLTEVVSIITINNQTEGSSFWGGYRLYVFI